MGHKIFTRIATLALSAFLLISFAPTASAQSAPDLSHGCFKGLCLGQSLPKNVADALRKKPDDVNKISAGFLDGLGCLFFPYDKKKGPLKHLYKAGRYKAIQCQSRKNHKRYVQIELVDDKIIMFKAAHIRHPSSLPTPAEYSRTMIDKYRGRLHPTSVAAASVTLKNRPDNTASIQIDWWSDCPNAKSSSNLGTCFYGLEMQEYLLRKGALEMDKKLRERAKKKSYDDIP